MDARFSAVAALLTLLVALGAALKGAVVVAAVWGVLSFGFVVRAALGYRNR